jgi:MoCo/4Fe-4S cofactor protein with predicted Tat translocation signal
MKHVFQHPPADLTGKQYWRSLEEQADTPEFREWLEREFPAGASELELDGLSRRNFLQLMGASVALAGFGLSGCRRPESHITPYTKSLEWIIPGRPLLYASAMPRRRGAIPLVVTTHEGRPTKIEGNPLHPIATGATDTLAQASILDLYDPDRSKQVLREGRKSSLEEFIQFLRQSEGALASGGLAVIARETQSPTRLRLQEELRAKYPRLLWCNHEPATTGFDKAAATAVFGEGAVVHPNYLDADVILSLGSDFLCAEEGGLEASRDFSKRRRLTETNETMNRLYVVENRFTVTGGMADHRYRTPVSHIPAIAAAFAKEVAALTGNAPLGSLASAIDHSLPNLDEKWIHEAAKDLAAAKGRALVVAGADLPVQVQILVHAINAALGAIGTTVQISRTPVQPTVSLPELTAQIQSGAVTTVILLDTNPVYDAPADLQFGDALGKVGTVIHLGLHENETSEKAHWHIPAAHYLESWGDALSQDGTYVPVQPMIEPLWGGISDLQLLALVLGADLPKGPELVRATFEREAARTGAGASMDEAWTNFLRDGFLPASAPQLQAAAFNASAAASAIRSAAPLPPPVTDDGCEIVFVPDSKVDDGRYANNGWLQELPDTVTRLTWDNAAWISPATAKRFDAESSRSDLLKNEYRVITIEVDGRSISIPALVAPGHADNSITLPLGYGRTKVGRVGTGAGVNAYAIRTSTSPYVAVGAKVQSTNETRKLAVTHGHWTMEGRGFFREAPVAEYKSNPTFAKKVGMDSHIPPNISLYTNPKLDAQEQWAMVFDLTTCSGCNACVVACQAENNIPIVGKEQVINHREMHWIRIDRYFATVSADQPNPEMVTMPVPCQHCENAPCETVCPVNATVHSSDGLNVMVYNRCIGTRYCANNCPYKVRRFNFFDYNKRDVLGKSKWPILGERGDLYKGPFGPKGTPESIQMQKNPNVTVRMRGVMEKCTFCVQRIEKARIQSKVDSRGKASGGIPANSFTTACAQACPTDSIVFGDKSNPESRVSKLLGEDRSYRMLEYLNVQPRVTYLARLRNPNPHMPDAGPRGRINESGDEHHSDEENRAHPAGALPTHETGAHEAGHHESTH